jgi:addiction module RelE/StbE family toxin
LAEVVWTDDALTDVRAIRRYISEWNAAAAERLALALFEAGDSLSEWPRRGRPGRIAGTRELVFVWPYVIVYEVEDDTVRILRVWHGAQDRSSES